jgi:hypothetical protein
MAIRSDPERANTAPIETARSAILRLSTLWISVFVGLSAVGGAIELLVWSDGNFYLPPTLLDGTPFRTFLIPGLLLGSLVGGASIVSAWATARIYAWRVDATLLAGGTLIAWIAIEWALVSSFSWLQIWYGVLGVVLLALGILQSENLRQRWVVRVTLAESIGYLAPTLAGVFSVRWSTDQRPPAWVLIAAGCLEGLCLGYGQASALPWKVSRWRYSMLTGIAAGGVTAGSWFALVGA